MSDLFNQSLAWETLFRMVEFDVVLAGVLAFTAARRWWGFWEAALIVTACAVFYEWRIDGHLLRGSWFDDPSMPWQWNDIRDIWLGGGMAHVLRWWSKCT